MKKPKIKARVMGVYCTTDGAFIVSPKWEPVARFANAEQAASTVLVIPFDDPDALVEQMANAMADGARDVRNVEEVSEHEIWRQVSSRVLKSLGVKVRAK
jgi:hypothetical protein